MDYVVLFFIALINIIKFILYLFPFAIFDNISAFFPFAYQNGIIMLSLAILSIIFGFIFLVYFSTILLTPIDDDIKVESIGNDEIKVNYKRTFLGQTIRFILGSKNVVTYYSILIKFISSMGMRLIPLLLIFSVLYFPILPNTKGYSTVGGFIDDNGIELKEIVISMIQNKEISQQTIDTLKNRFGNETPELSNMKSNAYIEKMLIKKYQNDALIVSLIDKNFKEYSHITNISEYEQALDGYINANLHIIIQDRRQNVELEKKQQIILGTIKKMNNQLNELKQIALGKRPIELLGGRVIYTGLQLNTIGYFMAILNWILKMFFVVIILLLSGWKNIVIMYLFIMETLFAKFESLQQKEFFQKILYINKKIKEIGTDIKEWEFMVQNGQNKEVYLLLVIEIMIRLLIVYYIIYF